QAPSCSHENSTCGNANRPCAGFGGGTLLHFNQRPRFPPYSHPLRLSMTVEYDALLLVSFGGPEGPEDVIPFLENVLRGKNVPRSRLLEVAEHYGQFGGVSPINAQNRQLKQAIEGELVSHGIQLP